MLGLYLQIQQRLICLPVCLNKVMRVGLQSLQFDTHYFVCSSVCLSWKNCCTVKWCQRFTIRQEKVCNILLAKCALIQYTWRRPLPKHNAYFFVVWYMYIHVHVVVNLWHHFAVQQLFVSDRQNRPPLVVSIHVSSCLSVCQALTSSHSLIIFSMAFSRECSLLAASLIASNCSK